MLEIIQNNLFCRPYAPADGVNPLRPCSAFPPLNLTAWIDNDAPEPIDDGNNRNDDSNDDSDDSDDNHSGKRNRRRRRHDKH